MTAERDYGYVASNRTPLEERPKMTWRCDVCGAEFDHFTYGGPCPGDHVQGCDGGLLRRKVTTDQTAAELERFKREGPAR